MPPMPEVVADKTPQSCNTRIGGEAPDLPDLVRHIQERSRRGFCCFTPTWLRLSWEA